MKPFQQVCNLKYIIPRSITRTQTLTFIGLQYNEPNPNVDSRSNRFKNGMCPTCKLIGLVLSH